ncbi:MAG: GxxExxY protein [Candidatus Brocadia sp.]|nr:GxxExxY protein [Candidatus Brocadia sp.]MDG6026591.1 GxxExxY protein [Candidatus Brocadia sp.]
MELEFEQLTENIIAASIEVHNTLGPGFLESVYENALSVEFETRDIPYKRQWEISIFYNGNEVGKHRLDMYVFNKFVVELKAIKEITNEHFSIVRSYLKAARQRHGLILNFAKPIMEIKRVIFTE